MHVLEQTTLPLKIKSVVDATTVRTTVLFEDQDFERLETEWDHLLEECESGGYFLRYAWNHLWWRTYAPPHSKLFFITCRDAYGQLIGLAPFYLKRNKFGLREIFFLGTGIEIKTSEYLNILAINGFEEIVANEIACALHRRNDWDCLKLWGVPRTKILKHFQAALGSTARVEICDHTHHVKTDVGWEAFRQSLGTASRKKIDYHYRRLFKEHSCEFQRITSLEELPLALDALIRLHQLRWESKGLPGSFRLPRFETFLRKIAEENLLTGRLRLWTLTVNNEIVTAQIAFFDRGIAHVFQGGFDPKFSDYRIGNVIFWLCIKDCIESDDVSEFDFMGGGAAYKKLWTKEGRELVELELFNSPLRSRLYERIIKATRTLRRVARKIIPRPILTFARRLLNIFTGEK
jgi:CelD/BcsL family acetyltransferase involved in cellulose biosynthesis